MKRLLPTLAGAMLLLTPIGSSAQNKLDGLHLGAEWGFTLAGYEYVNYGYYDSMGIFVTDNGPHFKAKASGYADLFLGYDFKQNHNISLRAGYSFITDSRVGVPVTVRYTNHFDGTRHNGPFMFAETGLWVDKKMNTGSLGKIGLGYRHKLSRRKSLDISTSARIINDHPRLLEPGTLDQIPDENIARNYAAYLALNASLTLSF